MNGMPICGNVWKLTRFRFQQDVDADVGGVADLDTVIVRLKEINQSYQERIFVIVPQYAQK